MVVSVEQREEAIDRICEAQDKLREALAILKGVAQDLGDEHARRYLVANLECLISHDHEWLSRDFNCDDWVEQLHYEISQQSEGEGEE